jgi:2-polyprenyl-3-methyl-5-hydroxy-6-metoxy-1,4-benzoquinol methylase
MMRNYTEYEWKEPETCSHDYIVPAIIKIIKKLGLPSDAKVLDAGCGGGSLVHTIHNELGFKNIYGFDASKSGIEVAKKNFPEIAENFFIHNVYEVKLPDYIPQRFDLVISMEVIEHLYSPKDYLANINQWLKNDGYLILTTPYHGYVKNLAISLLNKWDKHHTVNWEGGHIKFFSKNTLQRLLHKTGFLLVKFHGKGRLPFLWKSMIIVAQKV